MCENRKERKEIGNIFSHFSSIFFCFLTTAIAMSRHSAFYYTYTLPVLARLCVYCFDTLMLCFQETSRIISGKSSKYEHTQGSAPKSHFPFASTVAQLLYLYSVMHSTVCRATIVNTTGCLAHCRSSMLV